MTFNWKQALGSVALSAMALSMIGTGGAVAQTKPDTVKPNPPTAEKIETGQLLIKDKPRPPAVEKGIKDQGVKSCNGCGMTGKEAAPPPVDDAAAPPSAEKIETGQLLIRDKDMPKPSSVERGIKDQAVKNIPQPGDKRTKSKGPKVRDDPISTKSSLLPVAGGVAALAALAAAVGGGNDNPTSP